MTLKHEQKRLHEEIKHDVAKNERHAMDHFSIVGQTIFLGTIGVLISVPIVAGAYIGWWLDSRSHTFSFSWTVSLILVGVGIGVFNVIYFIKEH